MVSILSILVTIASSFLTVLYWGNPFSNIKAALNAAAAYDGIDSNGQPMSFSFVVLFNNFLVFSGLKDSALSNSIVESPRIYGVVFLILLLIVSLGVGELQTYLLAVTTIQFIPTVSYTYTRIWTIIAIALLLKFHSEIFDPQKPRNNKIFYLWWVTILGTNTIISLWTFRPMSLTAVLSFLALLAIVIWSFKLRLIFIGVKHFFSNPQHVAKVKSDSFKTKGL
jgi:hypothetical protein